MKFIFELNFHNFKIKEKVDVVLIACYNIVTIVILIFEFHISFFLLSHASSHLMIS
jgi:hypothetical protein